VSRQAVHEAADREVLDQAAVAVEEHHGLALALLEVVQAHAVHLEEVADGRRLTLGSPRLHDRIDGSRNQGGY